MKEHDDGNDGRKKPFYENIAAKASRKRTGKPVHAHPPRGAGRDADGKPPRRDGDSRPARGAYADRGADGKPPRRDGDSKSRPHRAFAGPALGDPVFGTLGNEARELLASFQEIAQTAMPLDSKKLQELPTVVRDLSHSLTDERSERRLGYMNDPANLSAYVRYFMWWNLVRLTRLFVSTDFRLKDGDAACDLGSGPLTIPVALWIARPDLRALDLTWYCVDISQNALAAGEELFLSLAAKTGGEPWKIVRVKGSFGVSLKRRVELVASANMFNEVALDGDEPIESVAKRLAGDLASYASEDGSVLVIEPGIPRAARFISLLRDSLASLGLSPVSPCPHDGPCPFPGLRHGKWCHFAFDASDAPPRLRRLSEDANLPKDRAALSFVLSRRRSGEAEAAASPDGTALETVARLASRFTGMMVRIVSDPIKLPDYYTGRYGCSERGMVLVCGTYGAADWLATCHSGSLIEVPRPDKRRPERDPKTDAILIRLNESARRDDR